jgi:hypothetical protein
MDKRMQSGRSMDKYKGPGNDDTVDLGYNW